MERSTAYRKGYHSVGGLMRSGSLSSLRQRFSSDHHLNPSQIHELSSSYLRRADHRRLAAIARDVAVARKGFAHSILPYDPLPSSWLPNSTQSVLSCRWDPAHHDTPSNTNNQQQLFTDSQVHQNLHKYCTSSRSEYRLDSEADNQKFSRL